MVNIHNGTFDLKRPGHGQGQGQRLGLGQEDGRPQSVTVTLAQYEAKGGKMVESGLDHHVTLANEHQEGTDKKYGDTVYGAIDAGCLGQ